MSGWVDLDVDLHEVGQRLHQGPAAGETAVDPQARQRLSEVVGHGRAERGDLGGDALQDRDDQVASS